MDNKKFEQLIDLIINENEEQAKALFHDIVVEKSREIYESMMDEELEESAEEELEEGTEEELEEGTEEELEENMGMGGEVGGLLDEIGAEEEGMTEEDDEFADIDMGSEDDGEVPEGDLEDRVVELEDKLDELMAEFEEMMGSEGGEEFGGDDMGGDDMGGEEFGGEEEPVGDEEMMEAVQLQKVSVTHGDNGVNNKSIVSSGPKVGGNGATAANIAKGGVASGEGTKGGLLNPAVKDIPGNYKNAPGKGNFSEKGESVAKPKQGDDGVNKKSITSESRKVKSTKKIVK
jgi:hypothetical protein